MRNLLAIETSGASCSVSLAIDGNRFSLTEHVGRGHNERLLPMLSSLCARAGHDERDLAKSLDGVAFGCGPGSFTGVRIAAAAAQAMAFAWSIELLRVPSSAALAQRALASGDDCHGVITLIRSRADVYYVGEYRRDGATFARAGEETLRGESPSRSWYSDRSAWLVAGAEPTWWQGRHVVACEPHADQVLDIGLELLAAGGGVDAALGLPEYVGGDTPWRPNRS